jgi:hypothetical protein
VTDGQSQPALLQPAQPVFVPADKLNLAEKPGTLSFPVDHFEERLQTDQVAVAVLIQDGGDIPV